MERKSKLVIVLKGNAKEKGELKMNSEDYSYFEKVWKVRQFHMAHNLPLKYVFLLRVCGRIGCPHPLSHANSSETLMNVSTDPVLNSNKRIFFVCR